MALVKWWMRHYGSATAKRHYAYGNSKAIRKLDKGKLQMSSLLAKDTKVKTCTKYRDRSGNLRYKGTSDLKKTEFLDLSYICKQESYDQALPFWFVWFDTIIKRMYHMSM